MGFLDRLLGREPQRPPTPMPAPVGRPYEAPAPRGGASVDDERAIARYRYLLRTAPPEDIERVHAEAFAQLSQEQRQMVLQRLTEDLPEAERPRSTEPADLARSATRAELSRPGYLQRSFGGGMGMGGMFAGSMLGTIAGVVVGSAVADALFDGYSSSPEAADAGDTGAGQDGSGGDGSGGDSGTDTAGDSADGAGSDPGLGDAGGDSGFEGFGDFGGGDFGF